MKCLRSARGWVLDITLRKEWNLDAQKGCLLNVTLGIYMDWIVIVTVSKERLRQRARMTFGPC